MRKRIGIGITYADIEFEMFKEYPGPPWVAFNSKQVNLVAAYSDPLRNCFVLILTHPEFEPIPPGESAPIFSREKARLRFPYLFADNTDPLLYRRFSLA